MNAETVTALVGRARPLKPAVMVDGKPSGGETITTNEGHVRLAVFEGRLAPKDAMTEMDRIAAAQKKAHGEAEYRRGQEILACRIRQLLDEA